MLYYDVIISETPISSFHGGQWIWTLKQENLEQKKFSTKIIDMELLKLNIKWGKSSNQGALNGDAIALYYYSLSTYYGYLLINIQN
jgi:hypothetical protein